MYFSNLFLAGGIAQLGLAAYSIKDDYSADNFFNMFTFDTVRFLVLDAYDNRLI